MGYRGKVAERERARTLRAAGLTMADIAGRLGVSRSSVSLWTRDVAFEPRRAGGARRRGPNVLQRRKQEQIEAFRLDGQRRIGCLSEREFLMAGLALYAGEGAKTDGLVRFANTDPTMVAFFCRWLRQFFDVDEARLRARLYLHQGLDLEVAEAFWSDLTRIPRSQFVRPYRAVADPTIRRAKHPLGCAYVTYCCVETHRAVMGLVRALLSCPEASIPG